jgi:NADH-quinone oxidoreductase subunit N
MTQISINDLISTGALTIVALASLAALVADAVGRRSALTFVLSAAGLMAGGLVAAGGMWSSGLAYAGMVNSGGYADFCAVIFCIAGLFTLMLSHSYLSTRGIETGEYYVLVLLSVTGMMMMAAAADLIVLFLGLELMSVSFYVLAGYTRKSLISNESALKYFLLGAFATGFLLYGISLAYAATGTTNIATQIAFVTEGRADTLFLIGLALMMIGFVFKIAAVPFHMWVPDVYEGAPTTVTALMSTGGKAAAFSAFLVVFAPALVGSVGEIREIIAVLAALSMVVGNVMAVSQTSVKRMLAYSSIAHAGYITTGLVAGNAFGSSGVLFYLLAYTVMNIGAFGVLSMVESSSGGNLSYDDYVGFAARNPLLAGLLALFMFSLTGIPPFAGFLAKYYVFAGAVSAGYTWLAIVGVIMSIVSAYYYLRLVVFMYFKDRDSVIQPATSGLAVVALLCSALIVISLGLYPDPVVNLTSTFF